MSLRVFITGATGFIGGALLREFANRGFELHALVRPSSERAGLQGLDVTWHEGSLGDADSLAAFLRDARDAWLVHNAAVISYRRRDRDLQWRVNVEGTRGLLTAARAAGVGRVCHVSSVVTVGHALAGETLDEDSEFTSAGLGIDYIDTKRAAEELALSFANDLDVRVVNPCAVYGASTRSSNSARFICSIAKRQTGPVAPPGELDVVGLRDVASGIRLALERGRTGRRYLLTESHHTALELFQLVAAELGVAAVKWRCPEQVWRLGTLAVSALDRVRPFELATPQTLQLLGLTYRCSSARARTELGWSPAAFDDVLAETIASLRARGDLD